MNTINKPLLAVLSLALFSLAAFQTKNLLVSSDSKVLGVITIPTPIIRPTSIPVPTTNPIAAGIPCSVINTLQQKYCSTNYPSSPTPTPNYPSPTRAPTITQCKYGVNSFSVYNPCEGGNYRNTKFTCYDGKEYTFGDITSCKTSDAWRITADTYCRGRSNCTTTSVTPTRAPSPTPTYYKPVCTPGTITCTTSTLNVNECVNGSWVKLPSCPTNRLYCISGNCMVGPSVTPSRSPSPTPQTPITNCDQYRQMKCISGFTPLRVQCDGIWITVPVCPSGSSCINNSCI